MGMGVFTRTGTWTLDGQGGMSMQGDSPEYEYRGDCRSNRLSCVVEPRTAAMGMGVAKRRKAAHECLGRNCLTSFFSEETVDKREVVQDSQTISRNSHKRARGRERHDKVIHIQESPKTAIFDLYTKLSTLSTKCTWNRRFGEKSRIREKNKLCQNCYDSQPPENRN